MNIAAAQEPRLPLRADWAALEDVGPIHRRRSHPAAKAVVKPTFLLTGALVGGLVLVPVGLTVWVAVTSGSLAPWTRESVWRLDGFVGASWRTVLWIGLCGVITAAALGIAYAAHQHRPEGRTDRLSVVRAVLVAPVGAPLVVTGVAFRLLYQPDAERGPASYLFGWLLGDGAWLEPGPMVTVSLMLAFVWVWLGFAIVVFRRALRAVPAEVKDVVVVQASRHSRFFRREARVFFQAHWTPELRRIAPVVFLPMVVMSMRVLDLVLVTAPEPSLADAKVLPVLHWEVSGGRVTGPSAALGLLWWAVVAVVVWLVLAWARPRWSWPASISSTAEDAASATSARTARPVVAVATTWLRSATVTALWSLPLVMLVLTSLRSTSAAAADGWRSVSFDLESYGELFRSPYWAAFRTTAGVTVVVCAAVVAAASLAVQALDGLSRRAAGNWVRVLVVAAVVPVQVIVNPLSAVFDFVQRTTPVPLPDTLRLALAHVALTAPLAVAILYAAGSRPAETLRASRTETSSAARPESASTASPLTSTDGAATSAAAAEQVATNPSERKAGPGPTSADSDAAAGVIGSAARQLRAVWHQEPAVVAVFILVFVLVWNDFVVGLFFAGHDAETLALFLFGQTRQFVVTSGPLSAGSVVMLLVPVCLVILTHRKVVEGLIGTTTGGGG